MFYKLSSDRDPMLDRDPMARQRPSLNFVTLTLFSRSRMLFKVATYAIWFPLIIWENIWNFVHSSTRARWIQRWNWVNLTLFSRSERPFNMVPAQYVKKYLTYSHQIWCTEATGQNEILVKFWKFLYPIVGLLVVFKRAYFEPFRWLYNFLVWNEDKVLDIFLLFGKFALFDKLLHCRLWT